ncbi:D-aminoacyl-tRNA deacylase [Geodia barretti]|uniref:D-aminoacyl-tRNA deacylase n=1 Tax=Geodia barretti TaxID=519541 RepID=A0AA35TFI4_GEOBA|nr:D-aminoacyl-tRNA deacylase [Geodia barretti]
MPTPGEAAAPTSPLLRLPTWQRNFYERTVALLRDTGLTVATGRFQAYMQVKSQNDGPVTIMLDSADRHRSRH